MLLLYTKVWNGGGLRMLTSTEPVNKDQNKGERKELEKIYPVPSRDSPHGSLRHSG